VNNVEELAKALEEVMLLSTLSTLVGRIQIFMAF
jgi:hypothetical protein